MGCCFKRNQQDSLVCYEWCTFDIGDYKKAIDKSRCKSTAFGCAYH